MSDDADFGAELSSLLRSIETIRAEYDRHGPGRVPQELSLGLSDRAAALTRSLVADQTAALATAIRDAADLATRCATRSEGLCFITGEAGLIPRRDLHQRFDAAMETMRNSLASDAPG